MKYRLIEICAGITDGSHNPPAGGCKSDYMMISSKNVFDDEITLDDPRYLTEDQFNQENKRTRVASGDVLMTIVGTVGRTAVVPNDFANITLQRSVAVLHPNNDICKSRYLMYLLRAKRYYFESEAHGVAQKGIYLKQLSDVMVDIPEIAEQTHILDILDHLQKVIFLRKQELIQLNEIVKARFVEMFGSYECTTTVGNYIAELRGGKSLAGTTPCKNKVLKTGAATFGWFDPKQYKYLPQDYEPLPEHKVEAGDVMISRMNTPELVGACSYVFEAPEDMYYPDRLWKVIPKNQANSIFIWQLLWDPEIRRKIKEKSGGTSGTMHNISKAKLLELECIDVPVNEQNRFADFVKQINKSKLLEARQAGFIAKTRPTNKLLSI